MELLIVIGIIGILVGILVPTINRVRIAARTADTAASISRLSAGLEAYFADYNAYPGPFRNDQIVGSNTAVSPAITVTNHPSGAVTVANVTATENMMIGLIGRLNVVSGTLTYDWNTVGQGPSSLNGLNIRNSPPYINFEARELTSQNQNELMPGNPVGRWSAGDTVLPEMLDRYGNPKPILYIRANLGNTGLTGTDNSRQYNVNHLNTPYVFPTDATKYTQDYQANSPLLAGDEAYFGNVTLSTVTTVPDREFGLQPKHKDKYILISAGPDGLYGTKDDVRNP